ncbi:MAG: glycosyltransferase family 2 protein [Candidatus Omnitrophota bacterium]
MSSFSAVIPVYNSENSLRELTFRLKNALEILSRDFEIIFVEDHGGDRSWQVITELAAADERVKGIRLSRNYGQHNAVLCGIRSARYEWVVTLDDDLQHPPEEIPRLFQKAREGYDVVYGTPRRMPHSFWRNLLSAFTKRAMARAMGARNIRDLSAFRFFRTDLRKAFAHFHSPGVLLDVLLSWGTTRFASITVEHAPRPAGRSNYTFLKLLNQTMLLLTGFSTAPLRLASLVGFAFLFFGVGVFAYVLATYFFSGTLPGFAFLTSIICLFSGAQLFALGIIGEYLARMFNRSMDRPVYVVSETAGEPQEELRPDEREIFRR